MRVIAAHVGGGFGCKIFLYPEYCLVAALARKIERPLNGWKPDLKILLQPPMEEIM